MSANEIVSIISLGLAAAAIVVSLVTILKTW